jgi:hypothetical protein
MMDILKSFIDVAWTISVLLMVLLLDRRISRIERRMENRREGL